MGGLFFIASIKNIDLYFLIPSKTGSKRRENPGAPKRSFRRSRTSHGDFKMPCRGWLGTRQGQRWRENHQKQPEQLDGSNLSWSWGFYPTWNGQDLWIYHDLGDFTPLGMVRIYEFIMILGILPHLEWSGFMNLSWSWGFYPTWNGQDLWIYHDLGDFTHLELSGFMNLSWSWGFYPTWNCQDLWIYHDLGDFTPLGIVRIYEFIMILGILPHLE